MDLNHAYYLVHVVEKQGFSAAARTLGIPKSQSILALSLLADLTSLD